MCIRCSVLVQREFPRLKGPMADHFFWGMTAFPFGDYETFKRQVMELSVRIRGRKRGWLRRFRREAARIEHETWTAMRELSKQDSSGENGPSEVKQ